jgi:hypothetical protein
MLLALGAVADGLTGVLAMLSVAVLGAADDATGVVVGVYAGPLRGARGVGECGVGVLGALFGLGCGPCGCASSARCNRTGLTSSANGGVRGLGCISGRLAMSQPCTSKTTAKIAM